MSSSISTTSPFSILGALAGIVSIFYSNFNSTLCKQTMSEDPDQSPLSVASGLGMRCLSMSHKKDTRLIRVTLLKYSLHCLINLLNSSYKHVFVIKVETVWILISWLDKQKPVGCLC